MSRHKKFNTIHVAETVLDKTPKVLRDLSGDDEYRLTKVENKRSGSYVPKGDTQSGDLQIVDNHGLPAIMVYRGLSTFLRTSPIVKILDNTSKCLLIETEGGVYKLEKLDVES